MSPLPDLCSEGPGLITIEAGLRGRGRYATPHQRVDENVPVREAGGRTLAEEIVATLAMPPFDQSAMDGYAVALERRHDARRRPPPSSRPRSPPGDARRRDSGRGTRLASSRARRCPRAADAVLMQEHGWRDGDHLVLNRMLRPGDNIRRRGEDIDAGELLLSPGERLDARHVALLASQGRATGRVFGDVPASASSRPETNFGSLATPLDDAAIYDFNRPMLMALGGAGGRRRR